MSNSLITKMLATIHAIIPANLPKVKPPKESRGRLLWDSSKRGTYIRKIHGELK